MSVVKGTTDKTEDANTLEFGDIFDNAELMTADEVYLYMSQCNSNKSHEVFETTNEYLKSVVTTTNTAVLLDFLFQEIREKLSHLKLRKKDGNSRYLHPYEIVQLANLVYPGSTVEEVLSLIISLQVFDEDQVFLAVRVVSDAKEKAQTM